MPRIVFGIMDKERRGFLAGIAASTKQPMAMANINKQHFLLAGSCAVVLSVFSRSSLGGRGQGIREVKEMKILRNGIYSLPKPLPKRRGVFHKNTRIAFGSNGHRMHL